MTASKRAPTLKGVRNARYLNFTYTDRWGYFFDPMDLNRPVVDLDSITYTIQRRTARVPIDMRTDAATYWYRGLRNIWPGMFDTWVWEVEFRTKRFGEVLEFERARKARIDKALEELRARLDWAGGSDGP